jgi:5S rRNA maturation endonuclease (ribonuclease M5)
LKRNIERAQKMSTKANTVFNIMPMTFILPKEYVGFLENFSEFEELEGKFIDVEALRQAEMEKKNIEIATMSASNELKIKELTDQNRKYERLLKQMKSYLKSCNNRGTRNKDYLKRAILKKTKAKLLRI